MDQEPKYSPITFETAPRFACAEYDPADRGTATDAPNSFEVGLVLAGAISAGAYTAGVMDFLIEALDDWEAAKEAARAQGADTRAWNVPAHTAILKVISGASAGGLNGAIAAAVLGRDFPHVRTGSTGENTGNPFFESWVNGIDAKLLLAKDDLADDKPIVSILDSTALLPIARRALETPAAAPAKRRRYVSDPLRLLLTVTNLRGVPYWMPFLGNTNQGHGMLMARDHTRFALSCPEGVATKPPYPNEETLAPPSSPSAQGWAHLANAALACSAFPAALQPREIDRAYSDYDYRAVTRADPPSTDLTAAHPSACDAFRNGYRFVGVDGGAMDNEPLELARTVLSGAFGRNPREGHRAIRATVMVDPFPEMPNLGPADLDGVNPVSAFLALTSAWKSQARFKPVDLALANADEIYSRFLIAPSRKGDTDVSNGYHLASGLLDGFGGFLSRELRVHDYLLGRRDCQLFLWRHFVLPDDNPLFDSWNPDIKADYAITFAGDPRRFLPVIPLVRMRPATAEEPIPAWPKGAVNPAAIAESVVGRFHELYFRALDMMNVGWIGQTYLGPLRRTLEGKLKDYALRTTTDALKKRNM